ncbi:tripartite motif-containing protein 16-like [Acanthochromis polyacanthus]|uniref:tripartite motif-containing protein 16-like n=1 Tax=Acanthochromis polyacanthus TaxID=80966 RepID=UPI0022346736|nr:tripartite motif-containing protein 16-like [Acanthochromis polyacanthus]
MAQKGAQLSSENISCSICLDPLKDPVTLSCGHSYCMVCIKAHWDGEDQSRIYSCPQCRKTFTPRPNLEKNVLLAELVEQLKKTGLQAAAADHCYAGAEDVSCDFCTGRKMKAVKSCLVCLASYCRNHLQPHYESPAFKKHHLVEPSKNLQENICSLHDKAMEIFCRTDQELICYLCSVDDHKGHDTVSAAAERKQKQKKLQRSRLNIQQRIQSREEDVKLLQQQVKNINVSADKTVEDNEKMFTETIQLIQKRSRDVEQQIRSMQETEVSRVKDLQEKLKQEITDLKRKDAELKQILDTRDNSQFLLNYPSESEVGVSTHPSSINTSIQEDFKDMTAAVKKLRDHLQDVLRGTCTNTSPTVPQPDVLLPQPEPEPKTRSELLQYLRQITLDPNTAHKCLLLSEGNSKVTLTYQRQYYPDHPNTFIDCYQVLSRESLTGRCYWEVEWRGGFIAAVSYKNISRSGSLNDCGFGYNDKSWSVQCDTHGYSFHYNSHRTRLSGPPSSRVGVYLDHSAGILSFYSVSETVTLLHRVQTTFSQPLHAGVRLYTRGSTVKFIKLT